MADRATATIRVNLAEAKSLDRMLKEAGRKRPALLERIHSKVRAARLLLEAAE